MSIPVALEEVARTAADYGFAYLLTSVEAGGAPHAVAVQPKVGKDGIRVIELGRRTLANAAACSAVALIWVPSSIDQYSLIVDGTARADGDGLLIEPVRAVLHRPAPSPTGDGPCASDCREILPRVRPAAPAA